MLVRGLHLKWWIVACGLMVSGWGVARSLQAAPVAEAWRPVTTERLFGMQYVPKFNESNGRGAWDGTRERGIAQHLELGVQVSREGVLWRHYEPEPGQHPHLADFDDMVKQITRHRMHVVAMVSDTPLWAATNTKDQATARFSPPRGLDEPIYANGTDTPDASGACNPKNTWASALTHMATRYRGRIQHWQIWNEPDYPDGDHQASTNSRRSWQGSAKDYVRLLEVASIVLKRIDPQSQILVGGLGHPHYLQAILEHGGGPYFDQLDFHAYGKPGSDKALQAFEQVRDAMATVLKQAGYNKTLTCSETGYTAAEPITQADYITKLYATALATDVQSVMYYATCNPSWQQMGLVDWATLTQRTRGFWAYQQAQARLGPIMSLRRIHTRDIRGIHGRRHDGTEVIVAWAADSATAKHAVLRSPPVNHAWHIYDNLGHPKGRTQANTPLHWSLDEHPIYVESSAYLVSGTERPNPPLPRKNLPFMGAIASSEAAGFTAAQTIDLDWNTAWLPAQLGIAANSLTLTLAHPTRTKGFWLKTSPTPPDTWFEVQLQASGKPFRTVVSRLVRHDWKRDYVAFPETDSAKAVRIVWHNPKRRPVSAQVFECE